MNSKLIFLLIFSLFLVTGLSLSQPLSQQEQNLQFTSSLIEILSKLANILQNVKITPVIPPLEKQHSLPTPATPILPTPMPPAGASSELINPEVPPLIGTVQEQPSLPPPPLIKKTTPSLLNEEILHLYRLGIIRIYNPSNLTDYPIIYAVRKTNGKCFQFIQTDEGEDDVLNCTKEVLFEKSATSSQMIKIIIKKDTILLSGGRERLSNVGYFKVGDIIDVYGFIEKGNVNNPRQVSIEALIVKKFVRLIKIDQPIKPPISILPATQTPVTSSRIMYCPWAREDEKKQVETSTVLCPAVVVKAISPDGKKCRTFGSPCSVPDNWKVIINNE